jgi:RNA polymerase sigma-70 factor, ECF subfamily
MNVELVSRATILGTTGEWDSLLGEAILDRDASFDSLVQRRARFVFRIAYVVLRNVEDAEDVVQDTFLKLFRTGAWKHMNDEKAFLARTAWRLAIGRKPVTASLPEFGAELLSREGSPERAAIETERSRTIQRLIHTLPDKLRTPLALSSIEEMSTAEIAAVICRPEGTVRRRLQEARALLKEKMARMEGNKNV